MQHERLLRNSVHQTVSANTVFLGGNMRRVSLEIYSNSASISYVALGRPASAVDFDYVVSSTQPLSLRPESVGNAIFESVQINPSAAGITLSAAEYFAP